MPDEPAPPHLRVVTPGDEPPGVEDFDRKVVRLDLITRNNMDPDVVLQKAMGELKGVVVLGYDHEDGSYFASSVAAGDTVLWMLERAKHELMKIADKMEKDYDDAED